MYRLMVLEDGQSNMKVRCCVVTWQKVRGDSTNPTHKGEALRT